MQRSGANKAFFQRLGEAKGRVFPDVRNRARWKEKQRASVARLSDAGTDHTIFERTRIKAEGRFFFMLGIPRGLPGVEGGIGRGIALALARPLLNLTGMGRAGSRDVVIVLDDSLSMQAARESLAAYVHAAADDVRRAVARARATLEDMDRDYEAPPPHVALRRDELQALRRHLQLTANLLPHVSNLDGPGWPTAHEEYERSWDEMLRAFHSEGGAAAP